jgi:hypothetical protein
VLIQGREINDTCLFVLLQISHNPVVDAEGKGACLKERYKDVLLGHDMALLWPLYPVLDIPAADNVLLAPRQEIFSPSHQLIENPVIL